MKDLKSIIKSLSSKEIKFIINYYKNNEDKKRLVMFKGILSGKLVTDEAAAKKTYGKKGSAYSHLKTRLKDDLLNLILFTSKDIEHQSAVLQAELDVDRMLMQAKLLHRRKVTDTAIKLLKEAFNLSVKFELIKEKVIVTYWYGIIAGNKLGIETFNEINSNLNKDLDLLQNYLFAYKWRYELSLFNKFSKGKSQDSKAIAKNSYKKLKEIYSNNNSKNIEYYYYITAIGYYSLLKDYNKIYTLAQKLNTLILNNIEVNSKVQEVNSYLQLFNATIHLQLYDIATKYALKSFEIISKSKLKNSSNELIVLEYIYMSSLREDDNSNLLSYLETGINHPSVKSSPRIEEKWHIYTSAYFFKIRNFNLSLESLYKTNILLKDKSGWLFTFKLLEIMCYIEQEEFDMVNYRIETFRKLLSKRNNDNIGRIKTIHQILKSLLKYGFNFQKTYKNEKDKITNLKNGVGEYYWDPLGFELIRFDTWFFSNYKV